LGIYKACDIRGDAEKELSEDHYRHWGLALGSRIPRRGRDRGKFLVAGDVRASTPRFRKALIEGLHQSEVAVVDLETLPTPMLYHALCRTRADGCAMVTASHNPPGDNGLKWRLGEKPPDAEQVAWLREAAEGKIADQPAPNDADARALDVSFDYVAWLQDTWFDTPHVPLQVVLDPMHGTWAQRARHYLQAIFPHILFTAIGDQPRSDFGDRLPNCSDPTQLARLSEEVDRRRASCGLAFDGDGDRVVLVDENGLPLTPEETTWLLLESFGEALQEETFVCDLKFSDRIREAAQDRGARVIVERSGHAFLRKTMLESEAAFGAEVSGHYFFRALCGGDDGLFTACWLIDYLAQRNLPVSQLCREMPPIAITPDFRVYAEQAEIDATLSAFQKHWSGLPSSTLDGLRVDFPGGWMLVRPSVTETALTFRFEAENRDRLEELIRENCAVLGSPVGDGLWKKFRQW
jgi:phosphomannomutase/phosphoglucomutase